MRVNVSFKLESEARLDAVRALEQAIADAAGDTRQNFDKVHERLTEADIRAQLAEKQLQTEVTIANANLAQEVIDRKVADEELAAALRAEAATRAEADEFLARALHTQVRRGVFESFNA